MRTRLALALTALLASLGPGRATAAAGFDLVYGGRLVDGGGKPRQGSVTLRFTFYRSADGDDAVDVPPLLLEGVPLVDGVFSVTLALTPQSFHKIFPSTRDPAFVGVEDLTNGATYPRQRYGMSPFAGKVPVDGKTVRFDGDGALAVGPETAPADGEFLTKNTRGELVWARPSGAATAIAGKTISATAPAAGQTLVYDGAEWKPVALPNAGASGSTAPAAGKAPLASAGGVIDAGWLPAFTGDTGTGGAKGAVPAPASGDAGKFLRGDGAWASPPGTSPAYDAAPGAPADAISVDADGRVGIGTTSPTHALQVTPTDTDPNKTVLVQDQTPASGSTRVTIKGGAAQSGALLEVRDASDILLFNVAPTGLTARSLWGGDTLVIGGNNGPSPGVAVRVSDSYAALTPTTGTSEQLVVDIPFAPTSGTAAFNAVRLAPTINQTGGADGITRGLYVAPTLSAAEDFRAIETERGNVLLGTVSGNVGIGRTDPQARLDVAGAIFAEQICDETGANCKDVSTGWALTGVAAGGQTGALTVGTNDTSALTLETNDTPRVTVEADGDVGIGTTSPDARLVVKGAGTSHASKALEVVNSADTSLLSVSDSGMLRMNVNTGSTPTTLPLQVSYGARIGNLILGTTGVGSQSRIAGGTGGGGILDLQNADGDSLLLDSRPATTASDVIVLNARPSGSGENLLQLRKSGTAVVTVDNAGKLGVGTTAPAGALHVDATPAASATSALVQINGDGGAFAGGSVSGQYLGVNAPAGNTANLLTLATNGSPVLEVTSSGDLAIKPATAGSSTTMMRTSSVGMTFFDNQNLTTPSPKLWFRPQGMSNSSGTMPALQLDLVDSTSGTGGLTGILVNKTGAGTGSGAKRLLELQSAGASKLAVGFDGNVGVGVASPAYKLQVEPTSDATPNQTALFHDATPTTGSTQVLIKSGAGQSASPLRVESDTGTRLFEVGRVDGGDLSMMTSSGVFSVNSGASEFNGLTIDSEINQTGTASGVTRGLYVKPNLASAPSYRAIETVAGDVVLGSTSGNVGVRTDSPTSTLHANGSFGTKLAALTTSQTLSDTDHIVTIDAAGGNRTLTLPSAIGIGGRQYTIKRIDGSVNLVVVDTTSGQTIDGAATRDLLAQWAYLTVVSDGANWLVIGGG